MENLEFSNLGNLLTAFLHSFKKKSFVYLMKASYLKSVVNFLNYSYLNLNFAKEIFEFSYLKYLSMNIIAFLQYFMKKTFLYLMKTSHSISIR